MSPGPARRVELGEVVRHAVVAVLWLAAFGLLSDHAFRLIPLSWARSLSLQAYLTFVQVLTASVGVGLSLLLLPAPRASLGLSAAPLPRLAVLSLLSPLVYVLASYAAIWAALPTLLAELAARGRQAVQASSGEFGRELAASGLGLALLWGVVVSPVAEELMFRGAVWSAAQSAVSWVRQRLERPAPAPTSSELPEGVLAPAPGLAAARAVLGFFLSGGVATLLSAGVFAAKHADMPGGMGIVRWVSALGLGVAAGLARQATAGLSGPVLLHVVFNLCALATTRRWLVTESFGHKLGVPILMSLGAAGAAFLALGLGLLLRARRGPPS